MEMTRKNFLRVVGSGAAACQLGALAPLSLAVAAPRDVRQRARIGSVEAASMSVPVRAVPRIALAARIAADNVLVRLRTDDGVTGWGESAPYSAVMSETQASDLALARPLGALLLGRDPFELPQLLDAMTRFAPGSTGIIAAFEMALWDICGKIAGQPVYRLLGAARESFETDCTVFLNPPETMARTALELVQEGFPAIKVKVGEEPALDLERVRAIRAAVGPTVRLRVDANQGWTVPDALKVLRDLEPFGLEFCEQPVKAWDWSGLAHVRRGSPVPIMADEAIHSPHDMIEGLRHEAFDMINIKLMKAGGVLQAVRLAHIAAAAGVPCLVGCMFETRLGLTAAAHVAMSQEIIRYADLDSFREMTADPCSGGMKVAQGVVTLPETPGLGVEIDPAMVKKLQSVA